MATTVNTTWATPRTWTTGELVTASIMNTHVRDQLNAVKTVAKGYHKVNEATNYTTTSTSFTDIDATDLAATITTGGGTVLVLFFCNLFNSSGASNGYLELLVDGAVYLGDDSSIHTLNASGATAVTFAVLVTGLSAGSHAFKMQWKTNAGTLGMYAGAGTVGADVHPYWTILELG